MDFHQQRFKLDESDLEFNLQQIESLYEFGRILKTDTVHISDGPGVPFNVYKLEVLQKLYGDRHPFRRITDLNPNANQIDDFSSSDNEPEEVVPVQRTRKKSVRLDEDKNVFVSFERNSPASQKIKLLPLFQKTNGEEDLIFEDDLNNAFLELRQMAPLPWQNKPEIIEKFKDLAKTPESLVKCEYCNFTPFNPQLVIQHMFNDEHRKQLAKHGASKKAIKYWQDRFLAANPTLALAKQRASTFNKRVPLMFDPNDKSLGGKRNQFRSGSKLVALVAKIDEMAVNKHGEFFSLFFEEVGYPNSCAMCNNTKLTRFPYSIISHLASDEHLKNLKQFGYYEVEYSFWCQILQKFGDRINKTEKTTTTTTTSTSKSIPQTQNQSEPSKIVTNAVAKRKGQAIQKARVWKNRIPLIFDPNDEKLTGRKKWNNGDALKKCFQKVDENKFNEKDGFFHAFFEAVGYPNSCILCDRKLSPQPYAILIHLTSSEHYLKLKQHGFYENEYNFWCQTLHDMRNELKKTITTTPSSPKIALIPLLGKSDNIDEFVDVNRREKLLIRLENRVNEVDKKEFNESEKIKAMLKKVGSAKCGFGCNNSSSVIPLVPSTVIEHCLTLEHRLALLTYGFTSDDAEVWMSEIGLHKVKKAKNELKRNIPRIPLIDIGESRQDVNPARREECFRKLNKMWDSVTAKNFNTAAASLMEYNKNGTCHACQLRPACFSNPVAIATHVFSPEHKKHMMKRGMRHSDVKLWTKLLTNAQKQDQPRPVDVVMPQKVILPVEIPKKEPVPVVIPQQKELVTVMIPQKEPVIVEKQEEKQQVQKAVKATQNKPVNIPVSPKPQKRVPLLDKPLENHQVMTDEKEIDEKWNQFKITVRNPVKRTCYISIMGKNKFYCTVCYKNREEGHYLPMSGRLIHHIFSHQHLKNLKPFGISKQDLKYWEDLFEKTLVSQKYPLAPIPLLYANIDNQLFMKYRKLQKNIVLKKFAELREKVESTRVEEFDEIFSPLANRHDRDRCIWCDFPFHHVPSAVAKHIVDEKHIENVLKFCVVGEEDFREWFDMFKFMAWVREEKRLEEEYVERKILEAVKLPEPVTIAKPQTRTAVVKPTPVVAPKEDLKYHRLALMQLNEAYIGPPMWPRISRLQRIRSGIRSVEKMNFKQKICVFCKCPVGFDILEHIYSVKHMYNAHLKGARFSAVDYSPWDKFLQYSAGHSDAASVTFPPIWFDKHKPMWFTTADDYQYTQEHNKLSMTLDVEVFNTHGPNTSSDYVNPTGCPVCFEWLLTPSEVARHLTGARHCHNMHTSGYYINKDIMSRVVHAMKLCQKRPAPPPVQKEKEGLCTLM